MPLRFCFASDFLPLAGFGFAIFITTNGNAGLDAQGTPWRAVSDPARRDTNK